MLKKIGILILTCVYAQLGFAQNLNPKKTLQTITTKFQKVQTYTADAQMVFNIPGVKLSSINGRVVYKAPSKFRLKAKGLFFLPKQNPMQNVMQIVADTASYTAISTGKEMYNGVNCTIINILPTKEMKDLVLGKFWVDESNALILKSEITTKNNGTVMSEFKFGKQAAYALPDAMTITMDVNKFKIPKMMAMDINKKSTTTDADPNKKTKATIQLNLQNYIVNKAISETEFTTEEKNN